MQLQQRSFLRIKTSICPIPPSVSFKQNLFPYLAIVPSLQVLDKLLLATSAWPIITKTSVHV